MCGRKTTSLLATIAVGGVLVLGGCGGGSDSTTSVHDAMHGSKSMKGHHDAMNQHHDNAMKGHHEAMQEG